MKWSAWQCWLSPHDYAYHEVQPDPRQPEASEELLAHVSEQFNGHRIGQKFCTRCSRIDTNGPYLRTDAGVITVQSFVETRYRANTEGIVTELDRQGRGDAPVKLPGFAEPVPLRDALRHVTELDIAITNAEDIVTFSCWKCKASQSIDRTEAGKRVRCEQCGTKLASPRPRVQ
jgi:DNA-directed RNA polymerase subunit RPC12/RpoP